MKAQKLFAGLGILCLVVSAQAATVYVNVNSPAPAAPYTNWLSAARVIQDAVDAAAAGDEIVVSNGVYQTGARAVYGMSNRVAVTKPVTVRSVNGPAVTQIVGYQVPGMTNGEAAVRCVYLTNGAVLAGFTLTNGATQTSVDSMRYLSGGGVWCEGLSAVVSNCVVAGNSATYGGGAYQGTLNNCALTGNSASGAGGAYQGTLNNCTLTGNSASDGGGVVSGTLNNCIVYYNFDQIGGANYSWSTLNYCCTTPLPAGPGNTDVEPQLASAFRLSADSPCLGKGSPAYASGVDVDGEPWANPPSIGCDEYWSGSVTGAVSVAVMAAYTNVAVGFGVDLQAVIGGRVNASRWDFGDGTVVSNRPWATHAWAVAGDYVVELLAYNESYPAGVATTVAVRVQAQPVHYVALTGTNPVPPYHSWATAATNIQDAVDAASVPGALVWVSDGVYQAGARAVYGLSNRVAVTRPMTVRSVNGPAVTRIVGYQMPKRTNGPAAVRCVYLTNGAVLAGFTLTNGATQTYGDSDRNQSGGGVWCEGISVVVSNCVLTGNSAASAGGGAYQGTLNNCVLTSNSASAGGGAMYGALNDCTLTGNSAGSYGGGAYAGTLNDCTLAGNSTASEGGGAYYGTLNDCVLTGNSAASYGGGAYQATLNNCMLTGNSAATGGGAIYGTLNDCTLTGNSAAWVGGGAAGGTLNHCTLTGNSASAGGGAFYAVLNNCMLTGNSTTSDGLGSDAGSGGGALLGTLNNCVLAGNSASAGGGASGGTLNNCVVYYNSASLSGPNYDGSMLNYCCTTPLPEGPGNLSNAPWFVDTNGWSNLRIQSNSPCINSGNNAYAPGPVDLDGNPRIVRGTVDMGAYEYQGPGSLISYAWLQGYGLPTDGSADTMDSDSDGLNNWQEWHCQTDPTNALSVLRLLAPAPSGNNLVVTWQSVAGVSYALEWSRNLGNVPAFQPLATNLPGQASTTTFAHTNGAVASPSFYRVVVP